MHKDSTTLPPKSDTAQNNWTLVIRPRSGWLDIPLREIWRYRDLILLFVRRDFVAIYKQTILGPLWFLFGPLASSAVFTVVFGRVAQIPTDGVPPFLFYLTGLVCWTYFSSCLTQTSSTFISNASIFGKVYFPRLTIPISLVISNLFSFGIQFGMFICFLVYFYTKGAPIHPNLWILALPLLIFQMALLGLGLGITVSALTTKYRDLSFLLTFGMQLWMYATPIIYPVSQVPEKYKSLYLLNPMTSVIECFRLAFLGTTNLNLNAVLGSWALTLVFLFFGALLFSRVEKSFMDTI